MTFVDRICDMVTQFLGSPTARTGSGALLLEIATAPPPDSNAIAGMINSILRITILLYHGPTLSIAF
jgi:hypothetical protein